MSQQIYGGDQEGMHGTEPGKGADTHAAHKEAEAHGEAEAHREAEAHKGQPLPQLFPLQPNFRLLHRCNYALNIRSCHNMQANLIYQ